MCSISVILKQDAAQELLFTDIHAWPPWGAARFLAVARVSLNLSFGGIVSKSANLVGSNNNNLGILELLRLEKTFNYDH